VVQLATRVPKSLRQRLRLYCAKHGMRLQEVVAAAIREKLGSERNRRRPET